MSPLHPLISDAKTEPADAYPNALFEFLLEYIPDRIYFKDLESRFIRVSRAKAERHGIADPRELIGKTDFDLFTPEHAKAAREDEEEIIRTGMAISSKVEKETLPGGEVRWALTTKMPFWDTDDRIIGTCGISKDITSLKRMEEAFTAANEQLERTVAELQVTHEALKAAQGQLVQAEKAQMAARLAQGVAHEVRNPLNVLAAGIDFLSGEPSIGEAGAASAVLSEMRDAIRRADSVICALMDSSENTALQPHPTDLHRLIESASAARQSEFGSRNIRVTVDFTPDLPSLNLDPVKIGGVFDSILSNARDAMNAHGGHLAIRTRIQKLSVADILHNPGDRSGQTARTGDANVVIDFDDTGPGVPPHLLSTVFDPFVTTKPTGSGTGLGLTVCRKIVELHRGRIELSNRETGGARVRITLPTRSSS